MKLFLKYIVFVVFGTIIIDLCFRLWCYSAFHNPKPNSNIGIAYPYESHNEPCEIAVLGASKANCHYNIKMIEDSLHLKVFNFGAVGEAIIHQYLCLDKAIKNGGLKMAILDLSLAQMSENWVNRRMSSFYVYYWSNKVVYDLVQDIEGKKMDYLLSSALYQYNSVAHRIIFSYFKSYDNKSGFRPEPYTGVAFKSVAPQKKKKTDYIISPYAVKYLCKMNDMCKESGVKFIVCISPDLISQENGHAEIELLCDKNNIELWDYSDVIHDLFLFKEELHMNEKGADVFTGMLIKRIKANYYDETSIKEGPCSKV